MCDREFGVGVQAMRYLTTMNSNFHILTAEVLTLAEAARSLACCFWARRQGQ